MTCAFDARGSLRHWLLAFALALACVFNAGKLYTAAYWLTIVSMSLWAATLHKSGRDAVSQVIVKIYVCARQITGTPAPAVAVAPDDHDRGTEDRADAIDPKAIAPLSPGGDKLVAVLMSADGIACAFGFGGLCAVASSGWRTYEVDDALGAVLALCGAILAALLSCEARKASTLRHRVVAFPPRALQRQEGGQVGCCMLFSENLKAVKQILATHCNKT